MAESGYVLELLNTTAVPKDMLVPDTVPIIAVP